MHVSSWFVARHQTALLLVAAELCSTVDYASTLSWFRASFSIFS